MDNPRCPNHATRFLKTGSGGQRVTHLLIDAARRRRHAAWNRSYGEFHFPGVNCILNKRGHSEGVVVFGHMFHVFLSMSVESARMNRFPERFDLIVTMVWSIGQSNNIHSCSYRRPVVLWTSGSVHFHAAPSWYCNGAAGPGAAPPHSDEDPGDRHERHLSTLPFNYVAKARSVTYLRGGERWLGRDRHGRPPVRDTTCKADSSCQVR
jgi:hypothetical protein